MLSKAPILALAGFLLVAGCSPNGGDESSSSEPGSTDRLVQEPEAAPAAATASQSAPIAIPGTLRPCAGCHLPIVQAWLEHGMADSLGDLSQPSRLPEPGLVANPLSGWSYRVTVREDEAWLLGTGPRGGRREQRLVGRLGAGVFDVSWVGEEVDPVSGEGTGRLFFAPVETVTGYGLTLSPFELHRDSAGMDMPFTGDCLTCHTTDRVSGLDGASVAAARGSVYPGNALGAGALQQLAPIGCDACHGPTARHLAIASGQSPPDPDEGLGVRPMHEHTAAERRDVCARCHLQGETRSELISGMVGGAPHRDRPLAGQIPVLVPTRELTDFRFVGQTEQLALSPCFLASAEMTCSTCHDPHTAVRAQGTPSFDAACASCHDGENGAHGQGAVCSRTPLLTVEQVAGRPARTETGCVDCHMVRAQPADLPHIETADHRVRRHLPPPAELAPDEGPLGLPAHRGVLDRDGPMRLYADPHDSRLNRALSSPSGQLWQRGVLAMGMVSLGRMEDAIEGYARFPEPGTAEARQPTAPELLVPLETEPLFHHLRALVLQGSGRFEAALAAYGDALALDPERAGARVGRAELRLRLGHLEGMVADTEEVIRAHPKAEAPWLLRAEVALRLQRPDMALQAFQEAAARWPSNAAVWVQIARLREAVGRLDAAQAEARAEALAPGISTQ